MQSLVQPLATVAPLVLPVDAAGTTYEGFVTTSAQARSGQPGSLWLRISGVRPGAVSLRGSRLEVGAELASLLEGQGEVLAQRLAESPSLPAFLVELQNLVDQLTLQRPLPSSCSGRPAAFYSRLKEELDGVGWCHVTSLSADLACLTFQLADGAGRRHDLRLTLPPDYPAAPPAASADLPAAFELRWGSGSGLADAVRQFEAVLQQYQGVWDSLDDLDQHAWVIEPATGAPRSALYRRIALGSHVSLALTLHPLHPSALPDCKFMGPDRAVAPLRQRLLDNRGLWQEGGTLRSNLEAVLQLVLPQRQGEDAEDASADCAICYAYQLPLPEVQGQGQGQQGAAAQQQQGQGQQLALEQGEAPDINCENAACGKPFHRRCLVEWLNSDTSTRQSFNTLFGTCPYCSSPITVKVT